MTTKLSRTACLTALRTIIAGLTFPANPTNPDGIADVTDPSTNRPRESFYLENVRGELTIPTLRTAASSLTIDDTFTADLVIKTEVPGTTKLAAETRVEELTDTIVAGLALNPSLNGPFTGFIWCVPDGNLIGPEPFLVEDGPTVGWGAQTVLPIHIKYRR